MAYGSAWRRRRRGHGKSLVVGIVVLVLALAGTLVILKTQSDQRQARKKSLAEATRVSDGFLTAWSKGDATAMAALATPDTAGYVRTEIPKLVSSLQSSSQTYQPGAVTTRTPASTAFHASVIVQGLGT